MKAGYNDVGNSLQRENSEDFVDLELMGPNTLLFCE